MKNLIKTVLFVAFVATVAVGAAYVPAAYYALAVEKAQEKGPDILSAALGAALALLAQAALSAAKKRIYGGWAVEISIDGAVADEENLSAKDGETVLSYGRPWWFVLLFGGDPTLEQSREVRQLLQSCCTPFGNVQGDVKDYALVDGGRRRIRVELQDGVNFEKRRTPPKPDPVKEAQKKQDADRKAAELEAERQEMLAAARAQKLAAQVVTVVVFQPEIGKEVELCRLTRGTLTVRELTEVLTANSRGTDVTAAVRAVTRRHGDEPAPLEAVQDGTTDTLRIPVSAELWSKVGNGHRRS